MTADVHYLVTGLGTGVADLEYTGPDDPAEISAMVLTQYAAYTNPPRLSEITVDLSLGVGCGTVRRGGQTLRDFAIKAVVSFDPHVHRRIEFDAGDWPHTMGYSGPGDYPTISAVVLRHVRSVDSYRANRLDVDVTPTGGQVTYDGEPIARFTMRDPDALPEAVRIPLAQLTADQRRRIAGLAGQLNNWEFDAFLRDFVDVPPEPGNGKVLGDIDGGRLWVRADGHVNPEYDPTDDRFNPDYDRRARWLRLGSSEAVTWHMAAFRGANPAGELAAFPAGGDR